LYLGAINRQNRGVEASGIFRFVVFSYWADRMTVKPVLPAVATASEPGRTSVPITASRI
jgi:hypothetical protein